MSYSRLFSPATLLAAVVTLAACTDTSTGPQEVATGTARFNFSGALSGAFSVEGTPHADGTTGSLVHEPFAFAELTSFGAVVDAFEPTTRPMGNLLQIQFTDRTVGTYSADPKTCEPRCAFVFHVRELDLNSDQVGRVFVPVSGVVEITRFSSDRVEGRFDGVILADDADATATLTLNGGTFAVSLLDRGALGSRMPQVGIGLAP
ncbi:MAG TPA: hypothetical protein VFX29_02940 [Longimicrobiaceae bacterium]|jgi:hypothetical protein|nr:hypothetical protein [Longimicrobiaceae bacterium]